MSMGDPPIDNADIVLDLVAVASGVIRTPKLVRKICLQAKDRITELERHKFMVREGLGPEDMERDIGE